MSGRDCAWRSRCPEIIRCRQLRALYGPPLFLLRDTGPLGFVIREEGRAKPVQVRLGGRHTCSCREQRTHNDLCLHICWVLLRRFKLKHNDPISFQLGLVQREIFALLRNSQNCNLRISVPVTAASAAILLPLITGEIPEDGVLHGLQTVPARSIDFEDSCVICLEGLLEKRLPVTHCRYSCGNHVHIRCIQVWMQHHNVSPIDHEVMKQTVKCPLCRGTFNSPEALAEEIRNAPRCLGRRIKKSTKSDITAPQHQIARQRLLTRPQQESISQTPIFTSPMIHPMEDCFVYNMVQNSFSTLNRSSANYLLKNKFNVCDSTLSDESSSGQDSDQADFIKPVPANILAKNLPVWRVPHRHRLLAPGRQCCLCLAPYQAGHVVSSLPCGHEFHATCLKPWLLRAADESNRTQACRCPLDDTDLIPWLTERLLNSYKVRGNVSQINSHHVKKGLLEDKPKFELTSKKMTLMSRRVAGGSSCNSSRSVTPNPSYQESRASSRVATGVLPPRHLLSSSKSSSVIAVSISSGLDNNQQNLNKKHSKATPAIHLLSLELPLANHDANMSQFICKPRKLISPHAPHRMSKELNVLPKLHSLTCSGFQLQLLDKSKTCKIKS